MGRMLPAVLAVAVGTEVAAQEESAWRLAPMRAAEGVSQHEFDAMVISMAGARFVGSFRPWIPGPSPITGFGVELLSDQPEGELQLARFGLAGSARQVELSGRRAVVGVHELFGRELKVIRREELWKLAVGLELLELVDVHQPFRIQITPLVPDLWAEPSISDREQVDRSSARANGWMPLVASTAGRTTPVQRIAAGSFHQGRLRLLVSSVASPPEGAWFTVSHPPLLRGHRVHLPNGSRLEQARLEPIEPERSGLPGSSGSLEGREWAPAARWLEASATLEITWPPHVTGFGGPAPGRGLYPESAIDLCFDADGPERSLLLISPIHPGDQRQTDGGIESLPPALPLGVVGAADTEVPVPLPADLVLANSGRVHGLVGRSIPGVRRIRGIALRAWSGDVQLQLGRFGWDDGGPWPLAQASDPARRLSRGIPLPDGPIEDGLLGPDNPFFIPLFATGGWLGYRAEWSLDDLAKGSGHVQVFQTPMVVPDRAARPGERALDPDVGLLPAVQVPPGSFYVDGDFGRRAHGLDRFTLRFAGEEENASDSTIATVELTVSGPDGVPLAVATVGELRHMLEAISSDVERDGARDGRRFSARLTRTGAIEPGRDMWLDVQLAAPIEPDHRLIVRTWSTSR